MKIKELVSILEKFDENLEVTVSTSDYLDDDYSLKNVAVIYKDTGMPVQITLFGGVE